MCNMVESILYEMEALRQTKQSLLIAIDGRCAAGKTTLAAQLQKVCGCNVISMDYFFLRPEQQTAQRLSEPGGNVDYERFLQDVLIPLERGETFSYRPYDCHQQAMGEAIQIEPLAVNIIEGSYCCHPVLYEYYDLRIFLTIDEAVQLRRIRSRNGEMGAVLFKQKWIPLEEHYFLAHSIKERCDLCFQTEAGELMKK